MKIMIQTSEVCTSLIFYYHSNGEQKSLFPFYKFANRTTKRDIVLRTSRDADWRKMKLVLILQAILWLAKGDGNEYQMKKASKKSIQLQTAYVLRRNPPRRPHYSVIVGSSGKSIIGPAVPESTAEAVHRVQGFILESDTVIVGDPINFAGIALSTHNRYRKYHHAQPLVWSDKLASQALKIAYHLASESNKENSRRFYVPDEETLGENVERFLGVKFGCNGLAALKAADKWYQESKNYSYVYPHVQESTNSFTQLVWRGSHLLGMGCALRKGLLANDVFVVALYSPPGNVGDGVTANVLRPENEGEEAKPDVYSNIFRKSKVTSKTESTEKTI